jgi:hypothetical protein
MYYLNGILVFLKIFITNLEYFFINTSYKNLVFLLFELIVIIIIIKYLKKLQSNEPVFERILWYRFDYDLERYYALFIVLSTLILYVSTILYLRFLSIGKTVDLRATLTIIVKVIHEQPLLIVFTLLIILLLSLYLIFILIAGCIRKYVHLELIKLHFYYLDKPYYDFIYNKFKYNISISSICSKFNSFYFSLCEYFALGYNIPKKNEPFRLPTKKEEELTQNFWLFKYIIIRYFRYYIYIIHYIILLLFLFYDIYFNNYIIQYTFKILPFLFVYQLYVMASKFVQEKTLNDICGDTNLIFYHNVTIFDENFALIDGELTQPPSNWAERFLQYESSGFTQTI